MCRKNKVEKSSRSRQLTASWLDNKTNDFAKFCNLLIPAILKPFCFASLPYFLPNKPALNIFCFRFGLRQVKFSLPFLTGRLTRYLIGPSHSSLIGFSCLIAH
ncbi:conserved hypothetical protein [Trichinella spiralis]|uniref:hypothetical protein n=1 Tax=Trichinella spiralis TaxID=6334 RepID=UPI0001EFE691|nr:conserved hypothetical protein [Trichinella spiralis]